ncbi:MAG: aspartate carbamoyltransferase [bacterium]
MAEGNSPMHVLSVKQFDRADMKKLFDLADFMEQSQQLDSRMAPLGNRVLLSLFGAPSTRTRFSFASAMQRLGGQVIFSDNAKEFSSMAKGADFEDEIIQMSQYGDVMVIRFDEPDLVERAAAVSDIPVISGGSGAGEHPTQGFLDLYTIYKEVGRLDDLVVTFFGDPRHSRTIHSLARLLILYNAEMRFVSPQNLMMPDDLRQELTDARIEFSEHSDLLEAIDRTDAFYITRPQTNLMEPSLAAGVRGAFVVTGEAIERGGSGMALLHPFPRTEELPKKFDKLPTAAYLRRQVRNGVWTRMALLCLVKNVKVRELLNRK